MSQEVSQQIVRQETPISVVTDDDRITRVSVSSFQRPGTTMPMNADINSQQHHTLESERAQALEYQLSPILETSRSGPRPSAPLLDMSQAFSDFFDQAEQVEERIDDEDYAARAYNSQLPREMLDFNPPTHSNPRIRSVVTACTPVITTPSGPPVRSEPAELFPQKIRRKPTVDNPFANSFNDCL